MASFASVAIGRELRPRWQTMPRHRHDHSYVSLILSGGYEETGDRGRFHVEAGHVLLHGAFDAHLNRFAARDAAILNLELPKDCEPPASLACVTDPDLIVRVASRDPREAVSILLGDLEPVRHQPGDWPELLAFDLARDPSLRLGNWGEGSPAGRCHAVAGISQGVRTVAGFVPRGASRAAGLAADRERRIATGRPVAGAWIFGPGPHEPRRPRDHRQAADAVAPQAGQIDSRFDPAARWQDRVMNTPLSATILLVLAAAVPFAAAQTAMPGSLFAQAREAAGGIAWDRTLGLAADGAEDSAGMKGHWRAADDVEERAATSAAQISASFATDEVWDGADHWRQDISGGVHKLDSDFARKIAATAAWMARRDYLKPDGGRAVLGSVETRRDGDRDYEIVTATPPDGNAIELWFDAKTHLLAANAAGFIVHNRHELLRRLSQGRPIAASVHHQDGRRRIRHDRYGAGVAVSPDRKNSRPQPLLRRSRPATPRSPAARRPCRSGSMARFLSPPCSTAKGRTDSFSTPADTIS